MSSTTRIDALAEHDDSTDTSAELEIAAPVRGPGAPAASDRTTTFVVRLPVVVLERVRRIAEQDGLTTSALLHRWIDAGIAEDGEDAADRVVPVQALLELIGRAPREHSDR